MRRRPRTGAAGGLRHAHDGPADLRDRGLLAVALVVAPERTERTVASFEWSLEGDAAPKPTAPRSAAARTLVGINPMADALSLFEALAQAEGSEGVPIELPVSSALALRLRLSPTA
jgi:hypothetical protein